MNDELFGIGRTFLLAIIAFIGTITLILFDKIPQAISLIDWSIFVGTILGGYVAKSGIHAMANKPKDIKITGENIKVE